jgi:hypothetical protein
MQTILCSWSTRHNVCSMTLHSYYSPTIQFRIFSSFLWRFNSFIE